MMKSVFALYVAAAATTAIAGYLHLRLGPGSLGFNANIGIFFIVAGIAQVFWIIPMLTRWGKLWYHAGIGGTIILIAILAITRMPGNPITGRGAPLNTMAIEVVIFEAAYIGLAVAIIIYESGTKLAGRSAGDAALTKKAWIPILVGIVVAIVLVGLFAPMPMERPMGPPPGQPNLPPGQ